MSAAARSDWDARKSDPSKAPGAADPEGAGPHNIDAEDPATGENYGEQRQQEIDDLHAEESQAEDGDSEGEDGDSDGEPEQAAGNDPT